MARLSLLPVVLRPVQRHTVQSKVPSSDRKKRSVAGEKRRTTINGNIGLDDIYIKKKKHIDNMKSY